MTTITLALIAALGLAVQHVDPAVCPLHAAHAKQAAADQAHVHDDQLNARGTKAMGFDQSRASHRFTILPDGGRIEIDVTDSRDKDTRRRIVAHLQDISRQFKSGDFRIPIATHAEEPAGIGVMSRLRAEIDYTFEATPSGGRVVIRTVHPEAREAVHAFLRYQIREHGTRD